MAADSEHARQILEKILKHDTQKVTLISGIDRQSIEIHRVILAPTSKYFQSILGEKVIPQNANSEIILDDVDGDQLKAIVEIEMTDENVTEFAMMAFQLEVDLLQDKCAHYFRTHISAATCIDWFLFAEKVNMVNLGEKMFKVMCKNFGTIRPSDIQKLDFETFKALLDASENAAAEEVIFARMVEWIEFDESARSKYAPDLLGCIRLQHIPSKALVKEVGAFCKKVNIVGFTEAECHDRLLNHRSIKKFRLDNRKMIFELATGVSKVHVRRFDTTSNRWRDVLTISCRSLKTFSSILFFEDKFFILGGSNDDTASISETVEMFETNETKTNLPPMKFARDFFTPIAIGRFIYVFGGYNSHDINKCERFDTASMKWKSLKPMKFARSGYAVAELNGYIYVAGGEFEGPPAKSTSVERYDRFRDEWQEMASMNVPRCEFSLVEWKGFLYAIGGNVLNGTMERYDCERNLWTEVFSLDGGDAIEKSLPKIVAMPGNRVVIKDSDFFEQWALLASDDKTISLDEF